MERVYNIAVQGLEKAKRAAMWGTYGKDGKQPLTWKRLKKCSTAHLEAILRTQHLTPRDDYYWLITSILSDRKK